MTNSWIQHVKHYAAAHNVPYAVAMIQARSSYTASPKKPAGGTRGRPRKGGALNLKNLDSNNGTKYQTNINQVCNHWEKPLFMMLALVLRREEDAKQKEAIYFQT